MSIEELKAIAVTIRRVRTACSRYAAWNICEIHTCRTGHASCFVDNVDIDAQEFGHFSTDNPVAGIGTTAGGPDDHVGDIPFGKIFSGGIYTGCCGQKHYQTNKQNLFHNEALLLCCYVVGLS